MRRPTTRTSPGAVDLRDLGLYVHVPFCERVCPYCDFAVVATGRAGIDAATEHAYVGHLLAELDLQLDHPERGPRLAGRPLGSVYLGGGTPGLLAPASLERLLRGIEARLGPLPEEVTIELNPDHVGPAHAPELVSAGVTRASLGVQSTHDETLKRLGRGHGAADALRGIERCLAAGFARLSVDLIWGAPGQTPESLGRDLERVLELGVGHVSAYALTIETGTPFARAQAAGRLSLPDEDATWRQGRQVRAALQAAGLRQYEISSFARRRERSRHNQRYWRRDDVLGLGLSAASLLGDLRFQNPRAPRVWSEAIERGDDPAEEQQRLEPEEAAREALYLGLRRLEGVSRRELRRRYGSAPEDIAGPALDELIGMGLLQHAGDAVRLSERGLDFADEVFLRLLP